MASLGGGLSSHLKEVRQCEQWRFLGRGSSQCKGPEAVAQSRVEEVRVGRHEGREVSGLQLVQPCLFSEMGDIAGLIELLNFIKLFF